MIKIEKGVCQHRRRNSGCALPLRLLADLEVGQGHSTEKDHQVMRKIEKAEKASLKKEGLYHQMTVKVKEVNSIREILVRVTTVSVIKTEKFLGLVTVLV